MSNERLTGVALCLGVLVLVLSLLMVFGQAEKVEPVEESPSYWHWLDEHSPREDTAHYMKEVPNE